MYNMKLTEYNNQSSHFPLHRKCPQRRQCLCQVYPKVLHMSFAALAHPTEGLRLRALLTLKVEKSLICLVGTRIPTVSMIE
jgi:hypothetical protein